MRPDEVLCAFRTRGASLKEPCAGVDLTVRFARAWWHSLCPQASLPEKHDRKVGHGPLTELAGKAVLFRALIVCSREE